MLRTQFNVDPDWRNILFLNRCFEMFKIIHKIVDNEEAVTMVVKINNSYKSFHYSYLHR